MLQTLAYAEGIMNVSPEHATIIGVTTSGNCDGDFFVKQEYGGVGSESGIIISHQAPQS